MPDLDLSALAESLANTARQLDEHIERRAREAGAKPSNTPRS